MKKRIFRMIAVIVSIALVWESASYQRNSIQAQAVVTETTAGFSADNSDTSLLEVTTEPIQSGPTEIKPTETESAETEPSEIAPTETESIETEPTETAPSETEPTETEPTETEPTETEPAETEPTETEPTESVPDDTLSGNTLSENTLSGNSLSGNTLSMNRLRLEESNLPTTLAEYIVGETYTLKFIQDFIILQELTAESSFAGIHFIIASPKTGTSWEVDKIAGFKGFGTREYPFQGSMKCAYDSGITFQFKIPLFAYLGNGALVENFAITCLTGCATSIADKIVPDSAGADSVVTIQRISVNGSISGSGYVGGLVSEIEGGAGKTTLSLQDITIAAPITGANAGGLVGYLGAFAQIDASNQEKPVITNQTVTGSASAGGMAGVCDTDYVFDTGNKALQLNAQIRGNTVNAAAGTLVGILKTGKTVTLQAAEAINIVSKVEGNGISGGVIGRIEAGTLKAEKPITITGTTTGGVAGGLVGEISGTTTIEMKGGYTGNTAITTIQYGTAGGLVGVIKDTPTITGAISVGNRIEARSGSAGGFAGKMDILAEVEMPAVTVSAAITGHNVGGLFGELAGKNKVLTGDTTITETTTIAGTSKAGGILGFAKAGSVMELKGKSILASDRVSSSSKGYIAGYQEEALFYLGKDVGLTLPPTKTMDEVGNYGGVYRNPPFASGQLIGDGTLANCGRVNKSVSKTAGAYSLSEAADFICLAIVLNTTGQFGTEAFSGTSAASLLQASYTVTANVDISYENTGIVTLNRNDKTDLVNAFQGTLQGSAGTIVITKNIESRQQNVGLFSTIGNSVFQDFTIEGETKKANGAGGIAYQSIGTSLTLSNLVNKVEINVIGINGAGGFLAKAAPPAGKITITGTNLTLASVLTVDNNAGISAFITMITGEASVNLEGIIVSAKMRTLATGETGGFLGHTWNNTGGSIQNVTIRGAQMDTKGSYGALLLRATTKDERLTLANIAYESVTITGNNKSGCAFLIKDGKNLILEVIDYTIAAASCKVENPGANFDEVVGATWDGAIGGVVSLHNTTKSFPDYHYENQIITTQNANTRYFYDLFQMWENADRTIKVKIDIENGFQVLDTTEKVMVWDAVHTAKGGVIRDYFKRYYIGSTVPAFGGEKVIFEGNLDMSARSFYPVQGVSNLLYQGNDNATLTFQAQTWAAAGNQHNNLQAGLLRSPTGGIVIKDLTLQGEIMNLGADSGVLVNQTLSGGGTFQNITLKNLWVQGYQKENSPVGLLIGKIPSGTVSFEGITMTGYPLKSTKKAAAALIGAAGGANEKNLILNFNKMKIADVAEEKSVTHNSDVLAHASFLYQYTYTDDTSENKGRGLYLFTEADATVAQQVTYGNELDADTEYQDDTKKVLADLGIANTDYKPYVFTSKKIEVNPKTGDILTGCGTYEDPYLLSSTKQFLTLYRYMNETGTAGNYQHQAFYEGWSMIKMGTDADFCSTKHVVTKEKQPDGTHKFVGAGAGDARIFGAADFPTPDELSRAYYSLGADINLQDDQLGNAYKIIAQEFVGFGTEARPFVGVWIGNGNTITLPDKKSGSTYSAYGLFQFVKGAVVKDMTIATNAAGNVAKVSTMGGSVFACILGGDNIIDAVTVRTKLQATATTAYMGGYVGKLQKGSLILRNIGSSDLTGFEVRGNNGNPLTTDTAATYLGIGQLVGKVEDGFVIYEGVADVATPLWKDTASYSLLGNTFILQVSPSFDIINAAYMDAKTAGMRTTKTTSGAETQITVSLPTEAALYALSIALNADALNIQPTSNAYKSGYNEIARCRKAAYDKIGTTNALEADYSSAVTYDSTNAYPYCYRYYKIGDSDYLSYLNSGESILNTIAANVYRTTYQLEANKTYDMTVFGNSFRGIGALYTRGDGNGATFRANFDGKGSTIQLAMKRGKENAVATKDSTMVGLFNELSAATTTYGTYGAYTIQNLVLQGSIDAELTTAASRAGGIAATIPKGQYHIKGITLDSGFTVTTKEAAGGIVGESSSPANVTFTDCKVGKNKPADLAAPIVPVVSITGKHTGGLVGYVSGGSIQIKGDLVVENMKISSSGNAGGLIGHTQAALTLTDSITMQDCVVHTTAWNAGGLIGESGNLIQIAPSINKQIIGLRLSVQGGETTGGLIGSLLNTGINSNIKEVTLENLNLTAGNSTGKYGTGGLVGRSEQVLLVEDVTIRNSTIQSRDAGQSNLSVLGGLIGNVRNRTTIKGITLANMNLTSQGTNNTGTEHIAGGLIGSNEGNANTTATHISLQDMTIKAGKQGTVQTGYAGGMIGRTYVPVTLQYYKVDKGEVTGTAYAGGAIGYVTNTCNINPVKEASTEVMEQQNIVQNMKITAPQVGGLVGTMNVANVRMEDVRVTACIIASEGGLAGGIIGTLEGASSLSAYRMHAVSNRIQLKADAYSNDTSFAAGGAIGKVQGDANSNWSELTLTDNVIGIGKEDSGKLKLLHQDKTFQDLPSEMTEGSLPDYANHIGSIVGLYLSTTAHMNALNSKVTYSTAFLAAHNRPVVDVGKQIGGDCYAYRNNCHIVYQTTFADAGLTGVKAKVDTYKTAKNSSLILDSYRLSEALTDVFDKGYHAALKPPGTEFTISQPMVVYKAENGTAQKLVDAMLDILTNVAGKPSSKVPILSVTAEPMIWDSVTGTGSKDTTIGVVGSIAVKQNTGGAWEFSHQKYDAITPTTVTYTQLTFTYEWSHAGSSSGAQTMTFTFPVFVEEMLEVDIHTRIMEGAVFAVDLMKKNNQKGDILMANDSSYTIYSEYVYNAARKNQSETTVIAKEFFLTEAKSGSAEEQRKELEPGTKLMLLDMTEGRNQVYYYMVPESPRITTVAYTDFKNADNVPYEEKAIKKLPNETTTGEPPDIYLDMEGNRKQKVGCEKFLLLVEKPEHAQALNEVYNIHTTPAKQQPSFSQTLIQTELSKISVKSIPGLKVSMVRGTGKTDIEGEMSKKGTLSEKLVFALNAGDLYWTEKKGSTNMIDSENHGKYLEAGYYLRDNGGNRVRFPEGTNVRFKVDGVETCGYKAVPNSSIIYFYKDSESAYQISTVDRNTEVAVEIDLDFSLADFSNIKDESYEAWIDLLRTVNKDYPMGTDTLIDSYKETIAASVMQQFGFATKVEDTTTLGINRYQNADGDKKKIPFVTHYDFEKIIESVGGNPEDSAQKWAGMEYEVTYTIYQKVKGDAAYQYEPYTGTDIQIIDVLGNPITNHKITYEFTAGEIVKEGKGQIVNRADASVAVVYKQEDLKKYLTNFKIEAALRIREKGTDGGTEPATKDFFVFTVTALKTDL